MHTSYRMSRGIVGSKLKSFPLRFGLATTFALLDEALEVVACVVFRRFALGALSTFDSSKSLDIEWMK